MMRLSHNTKYAQMSTVKCRVVFFPRIVSQLPPADFGGRIGLKLHGVVKSVLKMIVEWNVQS